MTSEDPVPGRRRRRIDRIADATFLDDLASLSDAELRRRRRMCAEVEHELSYQRRLVHARLDLLEVERRRRSGAETRTLIEALPDALDDGAPDAPHVTVNSLDLTAPETAGRRRVDRLLEDDRLARIGELDDGELTDLAAETAAAEASLSAQRRRVHDASDALDDELARRYRTGSASVDDHLAL